MAGTNRLNGNWRIIGIIIGIIAAGIGLVATGVASHVRATARIDTNETDISATSADFKDLESGTVQAFREVRVELQNLAVGQARIEERLKRISP